jgi:hypothetical protein
MEAHGVNTQSLSMICGNVGHRAVLKKQVRARRQESEEENRLPPLNFETIIQGSFMK